MFSFFFFLFFTFVVVGKRERVQTAPAWHLSLDVFDVAVHVETDLAKISFLMNRV